MSITDLHVPTGSSDPPVGSHSTTTTSSGTADLQTEVNRLTARKDELETRIDVLKSVLDTNHCTMQTPLVDPEGFPRADIDVAGVRSARAQIIRLRNDLVAVRADMEQLVLRGLPARSTQDQNAATEGLSMSTMDVVRAQGRDGLVVPFAKVNQVFPNSPAAAAGLEAGDQIVSIAHIDTSNHNSLRAVGSLVAESEGDSLPVVVVRAHAGSEARLTLNLTPRSGWGGRGLLGCHILPL